MLAVMSMVMIMILVVMVVSVMLTMSTLDDDVLRFLFAFRMQNDMFSGPVICYERRD